MRVIVFFLTVLLAAGAFFTVSAISKNASPTPPKNAVSKNAIFKTAAVEKAPAETAGAMMAQATATATTTTVATTTKITARATTSPPTVKATAVKSSAKTSSAKKTTSSITWSRDALRIINNPSAFDHSRTIRNAYVQKVLNYAKRNNIKVITAAVINGMRE